MQRQQAYKFARKTCLAIEGIETTQSLCLLRNSRFVKAA